MHNIFDMIKCDTWQTIVERNGFAAEKNLVLRDCYLTLQQLSELKDGLLMEKLKRLERTLLKHLMSRALQGNREITMMTGMSS